MLVTDHNTDLLGNKTIHHSTIVRLSACFSYGVPIGEKNELQTQSKLTSCLHSGFLSWNQHLQHVLHLLWSASSGWQQPCVQGRQALKAEKFSLIIICTLATSKLFFLSTILVILALVILTSDHHHHHLTFTNHDQNSMFTCHFFPQTLLARNHIQKALSSF